MFKRCGILTVVNFKFMIYDPVFYLYTRVEVYDLYIGVEILQLIYMEGT